MDPVKNFAKATVSGGYGDSASIITLLATHGGKLPAPALEGYFDLVWWNATDYGDPSDDPYVEVVRCTARAVDVITVTRGQDGTSPQNHNLSGKVYKMMLSNNRRSVWTYPWIDVRAFGAALDGVTNDTPAFQAAIDHLGIQGGTVYHPKGKALIDTPLIIRRNVTIRGPYAIAGYPTNAGSTEAPLASMTALVVNSGAGITLESAAGIDGCLIYRKGMTFPAQDASGFAGTAITLGRNNSFVKNSMILGFNKLIYGNNSQAPLIQNILGDGINGIEINGSLDIIRVENVHLWPFATYFYPTNPVLIRTGTAFKFTVASDWGKLRDCFSFGYNKGFYIENCNSMTLIGCGADQVTGHANSLGFEVAGSAHGCRFIGCQAGGQDFAGFFIATTGLDTELIDCDVWTNSDYGIAIANTGNVTILGGTIWDVVYGIYVNHSSPTVMIDNVRFNDISTMPIIAATSNANIQIGTNDYGDFSGCPVGGTVPMVNVSSASTMTLPNHGEFFNITGTTGITSITASWRGRRVTLLFASNPTVTDGSNLKLAGNFSASSDDTLTLICDGTNWYEVSRSVN